MRRPVGIQRDSGGRLAVSLRHKGPLQGSGSPIDGLQPVSGVYMDGNGNLFGTTPIGGGIPRDGAVYEVSPPAQPGQAWSEKIIHSFTNQNGDGYYPTATITAGPNGSLLGTTVAGANNFCFGGCGMAFQLTSVGGSWTETILYDFDGVDGVDGAGGNELLLGSDGAIYGASGNLDAQGRLLNGLVFELN